MFSFVKTVKILVMRNMFTVLDMCVRPKSSVTKKNFLFFNSAVCSYSISQHFLTSDVSSTLQPELGTAPRFCRDLCIYIE